MQPPSCSCQCKRHSNQAVAARETVRCFQRRQQPNSSDTLLLSAPTRSPACASKYGRLPKRQAAGFFSCDTCVHGDEVVLSRANTALLLLKPRAPAEARRWRGKEGCWWATALPPKAGARPGSPPSLDGAECRFRRGWDAHACRTSSEAIACAVML